YQEIDGGFVAFGGSPKGGKITGDLTCLFAKATIDESNLWHKRLGHINFKTLNKLVRGKACKSEMNQLCQMKGIKREFSIARTSQQNGVAERKNKTLIEAARTMLADSLLPTTFWAEVVNTACYAENIVLVTKPHNKTPYELLIGRSQNLEFMKTFRCPLTILNTLDHLGKFDGKADEGFLVGYSVNSKTFRVFNSRTRKVEENLHSSDVNAGEQPGDVNASKQPGDVNAIDIQEPKKVIQDLKDPSWIEAMQEELLQFKLQDARLVAPGYTLEEGIDYNEVFALVARIEAIRLFLAYALFKDFVMYQMNVKSAFLYDNIEEEVYACQPLGFEDPKFPDGVYKVEKGIIWSTRKEMCNEFEKMMHKKF
nr:retrovirus-related Pol polyprotein from transposon TNT 1-94 [Tanacetum cinerariifolium]